MIHITFNKSKHHFDETTNTFTMSEKDVQFATEYSLDGRTFKFTHSTGSEWDPKTRWVYKSDDGYILEVCNDAEIHIYTVQIKTGRTTVVAKTSKEALKKCNGIRILFIN